MTLADEQGRVTAQAPAAEWKPTLGAWPSGNGTGFRVWAPDIAQVELLLYGHSETGLGEVTRRFPLVRDSDGTHSIQRDDMGPGDRYQYLLDGRGPFPDPASRAQPDGVHGPSAVIDPRFAWTDDEWEGIALERLVLYELHVGTFTRSGTFAGVVDRLPYLVELGVTAVELMPVAGFAGTRNWGYDGVALFAPSACYGTPDELRMLINRAHELGLAVVLDVVYNHLGPDGAYHAEYSPYYFSTQHRNPWGPAINFDGLHAAQTRAFVIENALHWLHEYHVDGLRLDATHAIVDGSSRHIMADLAAHVRASSRPSSLLIAEDNRNLATIIRTSEHDSWGFDAVWADDLHHQLRRHTAGDTDGYFVDYAGAAADIAATIRRGWFYCGERSAYLEQSRGTDPTGLPLQRFVVCLQNHDQIGNRAHGDRLHHHIDPAIHRALAALVCCLPETPLLFMGQEWAAETPFQYFTDHHRSLGLQVTIGRRREFARFQAFADPDERARIPDPQAEATFAASQLDWTELERPEHLRVYRLYAALLALRRNAPALRGTPKSGEAVAEALGAHTLLVMRKGSTGDCLAVVCHLAGATTVRLDGARSSITTWSPLLTTEDNAFVKASQPPTISEQPPELTFSRPGAVLLSGREPGWIWRQPSM